MKKLLSFFFVLFAVSAFGQTNTGFNFLGQQGLKSYSVTMVTDSGYISGSAYRFFLSTDSLNINPGLISAGVWAKTFSSTISMPVKVLIWYKVPSWVGGLLNTVLTLDNGIDAAQSVSTFSNVSPGTQGVKEFPLINNGLTTFKRVGIHLSYSQGGTGDRAWIINKIAVVSSMGDTTLIDDGTGVLNIPPKVTLVSPANGATSTATTPTLTWNLSTGATSYQLQVFVTVTNVSVLDQTTTNLLYALSGLANNTRYSWKVRAINSAGNGEWSDVWVFTTTSGIVIPSVPILVSPVNGATNVPTNPTFVWNVSSGATSYRLQVLNTVTNVVVLDQSGITGISYQISGLANSTQYSWRMTATNSAGTSDWSAVWNFTTLSEKPQIPTLYYPINNAIGISLTPDFSWSYTNFTSSYEIEIATSSSFGSSTVFQRTVITTNTNVQSGILNYSTTYYWHVRAIGLGGTSDWSEVKNFLTTLITDVEMENEIPIEFALHQNYPNPFNPSTVIKFQVSSYQFVNLKIYDILGKEVATLVNEEKPAGRYKATFNASNLSSGVYIYKLQAGNFSEIRKMILMK